MKATKICKGVPRLVRIKHAQYFSLISFIIINFQLNNFKKRNGETIQLIKLIRKFNFFLLKSKFNRPNEGQPHLSLSSLCNIRAKTTTSTKKYVNSQQSILSHCKLYDSSPLYEFITLEKCTKSARTAVNFIISKNPTI